MRKIHRYAIPVGDDTESVQLPIGGYVIHVESKTDPKFVHLWVMFDDDVNEFETRFFNTIPTGKPIADDLSYIGTALSKSVDLSVGEEQETTCAWHVFERIL